MDQITQKTAHQDPAGSRWAVLRSEQFWRGTAGWSVVIFALAVGVATIGIVYWTGDSNYEAPWFLRRHEKERAVETPAPIERPVSARRAADGVPLAEGESDGAYFAALIDNMVDARPASGLSRASLVVEMPVEGGITRLLAFYPERSDVKKIGPVRSIRPYYLDWAQEFDAVIAHVGGSPEALERIKASDVRDLNQFFNGDFFWRSSDRRAPHNVYTSAKLLGLAAQKRFSAVPAMTPRPWRYKDDASEARPESPADLVIDYSAPAYRVVWKYDAKNNAYVRFQGGQAQRDEDGTPVRAKNIVVQYAQVRVVDEVGRRHITTVGKGKALVAIDGKTVEGAWSKKDLASRTVFSDAKDEEAVFNAGTSWVEVVPDTAVVTY